MKNYNDNNCTDYDIENVYNEACRYLEEIPQFMEGYGVDRSTRMLDILGHPEGSYKMIHVAGTNGKGSVSLYINDILKENGYTTGLFTSPHLIDIRERIRINGKMIGKDAFLRHFLTVKEADSQLGGNKLAYFDYFLGIAVLAFAEEKVDFAVMETGLGGRLDSTNALETPIASVITTISLEHTAILGDTVEKIAEEKAGIIKEDGVVVHMVTATANKTASKHKAAPADNATCYNGMDAASFVIRSRADKLNATYIQSSPEDIINCENRGNCIDFSVSNSYYINDCFRINTGAMYQVDNCLCALTLAGYLREQGIINQSADKTKKAVENAYWPGRMEMVQEGFFVDGAHNPEGIQRFLESVPYIAGEKKCILLFSVVNDKNFRRMAKMVSESGLFKKIVVTQVEGKRKLEADAIREAYIDNGASDVCVCDTIEDACLKALKFAKEEDAYVFAAGSLYLAGDILGFTDRINKKGLR